jgi:hypothetical protein
MNVSSKEKINTTGNSALDMAKKHFIEDVPKNANSPRPDLSTSS